MCGFIYSMNERLQIKNQSKDYLFLLDLIKSTVPRKKKDFLLTLLFILENNSFKNIRIAILLICLSSVCVTF